MEDAPPLPWPELPAVPSLFEPSLLPRVFAIPPGADYAAVFAEGLIRRLEGTPPEAMLGVTVLVNAARTLTGLEEAIAERQGGAGFLPHLLPIETAASGPALGGPAPGAVVPELHRTLALTRLVERFLEAVPGRAPRAAAPDLAASLADLLDLMDEEGVAAAALAAAVPEEMATHWQEALAFLDIARTAWPALREAEHGGAADPQPARRDAALTLVAAWERKPPQGPLLVAGSTGSRAVTAVLMAAIARQPQGALVLPAFDPQIDPAIWGAAGPDHPMGPFRRLFDLLEMVPAGVLPWLPETPPPRLRARRRLLAEALRPAPVTDAWVAARETLAETAEAATADLGLIEAPNQRAEAAAVALAVREGLTKPGQSIAVVTRDATLARRIAAELDRFGILPDDSLGRPLTLTQAGGLVLGTLAVARAAAAADPVALAALMAHPRVTLGLPRAEHRRRARRYEQLALRQRGVTGRPGPFPDWPDGVEAIAEDTAWLAAAREALAPLKLLSAPAPLDRLIAAHRASLAALTARAAGEVPPADGPDDLALAALFDRLADAAPAHGGMMAAAEYAALLEGQMRAETLRPQAARPHPRVALWGTIEARSGAADLTILAGLNEGSWPGTADTGPWLNRPMRAALGLPSPEREIGLAAHDFQHAACRPAVILSRARTVEGTPQVAARWLVRLETLLNGTAPAALTAMKGRGQRYLDLVPALDRGVTDPALTQPAPRPRPTPPVALRPRRLSVTAIETLIRDPYALYARRVLGLKKLTPLGAPLDARDRGEALHETMRRFVEATRAGLPAGAADHLASLARRVLAERQTPPDLASLWAERLVEAMDEVIEIEAGLRAAGTPGPLEVEGRMTLTLPAGPVTLTARADRLDRRGTAGAFVIDYKTGQPPSAKQIGEYNHQLHLQALILAAGGFKGLPPLRAEGGAYVGLTAGKQSGVEAGLAEALAAYGDKLAALIGAYDDPAQGYLSRQVPKRQDEDGDYDHLARRAEWDGMVLPDAQGGEP
ncbi:MAG: double-strand break repair protein AddB [Pseudomonadota bacterium]